MRKELLKKIGRVKFIPEGWSLKPIGDAYNVRNDLRKPISVDQRSSMQGQYPYYGPTGLLDNIDEYLVEGEFALIGEDGDHFLKPSEKSQTLLLSGQFNVNNHAHVIEGSNSYSAKWFYLYFHHRDITNLLSRQGASRYKLNKATLLTMPILLPPEEIQKKLFSLNQQWNKCIKSVKALIKTKEKQYSWLITRLANKSGYERKSVSLCATEVSSRNRDKSIVRVLSVTNHSGFVLPEEQFERRVASKNLSNYKIIKRDQYAYNPSRINVGSIARLTDWDEGVLSPMYVVFSLNDKLINSDYLFHWLSSHEAKQRIKNSAQGSVRETVSFGDLRSIAIPLPSLAKQREIANILNMAQQEIDLLKQLSKKYHLQKRGLMQKLLTGQWQLKTENNHQEKSL